RVSSFLGGRHVDEGRCGLANDERRQHCRHAAVFVGSLVTTPVLRIRPMDPFEIVGRALLGGADLLAVIRESGEQLLNDPPGDLV
ncbi:hypothetical protein DF186_19875, partial [Enterococcus hirae]